MDSGILERDPDVTPGGAPEEVAAPAHRMAIAVLALIGAFISGYLLLFKLGIVSEVACGVGDCGRVQRSPWAVFLGLPVPLIGVLGYLVVMATALLGTQPAFAADRRIGLLLVGLGAGAFGFSAYLTAISAYRIEAFCQWCLVSAGIATTIFLLSLLEFRRGKGAP
jgi:uncharacterized membrane protein